MSETHNQPEVPNMDSLKQRAALSRWSASEVFEGWLQNGPNSLRRILKHEYEWVLGEEEYVVIVKASCEPDLHSTDDADEDYNFVAIRLSECLDGEEEDLVAEIIIDLEDSSDATFEVIDHMKALTICHLLMQETDNETSATNLSIRLHELLEGIKDNGDDTDYLNELTQNAYFCALNTLLDHDSETDNQITRHYSAESVQQTLDVSSGTVSTGDGYFTEYIEFAWHDLQTDSELHIRILDNGQSNISGHVNGQAVDLLISNYYESSAQDHIDEIDYCDLAIKLVSTFCDHFRKYGA